MASPKVNSDKNHLDGLLTFLEDFRVLLNLGPDEDLGLEAFRQRVVAEDSAGRQVPPEIVGCRPL